jgi:hypothetical protein
MKKRDWLALTLGIFLAIFLIWKVGFGGAFPWENKLILKVSAEVVCWDVGIYKYCHYTRGMHAEVVPSKPLLASIEPLALFTNPAELSYSVTLTYPDKTQKFQHQDITVYESKWQDVYFSFPLTQKGVYTWEVEVCGSFYGFWACNKQTGSYSYGG